MKAPKRDDAGYYDTPYGRFMSVTTAIQYGVPKQFLVRWAASETAKAALDYLPRLIRARTEDDVKRETTFLRMASERKRDQAAELGTAVHAALEATVLEKPWPEPTEEQAPFLWAFSNFVQTWTPEWEAVELVLCNEQDKWAGTADFWAYLTIAGYGRVLVLGDYKTGKSIYPEAALQLSAYRRATHAFLRNGEEIEVPKAEHCVAVHLRPDKYKRTGFRVLPLNTSDATYAKFRHAQEVADYSVNVAPLLVGKAIEPTHEEKIPQWI